MLYQETSRAVREEGSAELVKVSFTADSASAELLAQTRDEFSRLEPNFVAADLDVTPLAFWFNRPRLALWMPETDLDAFGREMLDLIQEIMGAIARRSD